MQFPGLPHFFFPFSLSPKIFPAVIHTAAFPFPGDVWRRMVTHIHRLVFPLLNPGTFVAAIKFPLFIFKKIRQMKRKFFLAAASLLYVLSAWAQGNGSAGITEATQMVSSYFEPATKLIYAIGAVIGLIGGVKVYSKFSSGDPDTSKTAASWFGACIFLIVSATILRSFFL